MINSGSYFGSDASPAENPEVSAVPSPKRPTHEDWILGSVASIGEEVVGMVFKIDLLLDQCRKVLDGVQPRLPGRIDIRWWLHKSKPGRSPYVFKWQKMADGTWRAKHLSNKRLAMRAQRKGPFHSTAELTQATLSIIQDLVARREALLSAVGVMQRTFSTRLRNTRGLLAASSEKLEKISKKVRFSQESRP